MVAGKKTNPKPHRRNLARAWMELKPLAQSLDLTGAQGRETVGAPILRAAGRLLDGLGYRHLVSEGSKANDLAAPRQPTTPDGWLTLRKLASGLEKELATAKSTGVFVKRAKSLVLALGPVLDEQVMLAYPPPVAARAGTTLKSMDEMAAEERESARRVAVMTEELEKRMGNPYKFPVEETGDEIMPRDPMRDAAKAATGRTSYQPPSRAGKKGIVVYVEPATANDIRVVAAMKGLSTQEYLSGLIERDIAAHVSPTRIEDTVKSTVSRLTRQLSRNRKPG
jgi:hypothetical protein